MADQSTITACHCVNLRRATHQLTDFYSRILEPSGLTLPQFFLIKNMSALEPCSTSALARKVRLKHSTIVRNLQVMEAQGLIADMRESGRKLRVWQLTDKGHEALAAGIPLWKKAQDRVAEALGPDGVRQFTAMLARLQTLGGVQ